MKPRIKFPRSEKVYLPGTLYPELRVAMRKVEQVPSTTFVNGEKVISPNPDIYVYDTSGPFSDPDIEIDLKKGLPRLRRSTTCGLNTSHCPIAPSKANAAHRCTMPNKASSLLKWNMWLFVKT